LLNKKLIFLLIATISIMGIAACTAGGNTRDWDEHTLVYANLSKDGPDREAIDTFNRTHEDVQIEVRDYYDEDGNSSKARLLTDLLAGKAPDIIDMGGRADVSTTLLPYRQMVQKGYLENLWPYIENDPELGREAVLEAPLKAAEVDGGLYTAFSDVIVNTLIGAESLVGNRSSWSLEELRETFGSMPPGATVLQPFFDRSTAFFYLFCMQLDDYVDWKTGQCSFDCEEFRASLEFVNDFFPKTVDNLSEATMRDMFERMKSGQQMLMQTMFSHLLEVQYYDYLFGGQASFIGYPVEDGSVGSTFYICSRKLAMSSSCQNKEAAWEFIRQMYLPRYNRTTICNADGADFIHINRADYELLKRADKSDPPRLYVAKLPDGSQYEYHRATGEESQRYDDFINNIDKMELCDSEIFDIVSDASGPYFAGDKTLEETVKLVQNRVTLYVNENK
jgi:ABC-type glycerol-3-phosphate transport system substrate-binding protein